MSSASARAALVVALLVRSTQALSLQPPRATGGSRAFPYGKLQLGELPVRFINIPAASLGEGDGKAGERRWHVSEVGAPVGEVVVVAGLGVQLLSVFQAAGVQLPRGELKAPFHADMLICCEVSQACPLMSSELAWSWGASLSKRCARLLRGRDRPAVGVRPFA